MKSLTNKKLIMAALALVFVGLVGLITNDVLAKQPVDGTPPNLRGFGTGALTEVSTTVITIYGVLWALQGILNGLLTFTGFVLDNVFLWAISLNPGTMPIVATGWGLIRDISNSIFILIVLWIAFTIIFNFENLGGRKLLVRVIIMALLINFSLTMVSLIFGFANTLARPFRNAIADTSSSEATSFRNVSDIIMSNTKIYTVLNKSTQRDLDAVKNYAAKQERERLENIPVDIGGGFQSYLGAPQEAKAIGPLALAGCALGALTGIPIPGIGTVCAASAVAVQWATSLLSLGAAVGITALLYQSIIEMAVGNFFMIITIFALLTTTIVLIARIVAMTFLSILAPAAFLLYAMPNKYGEKYWNMWVENVLKWAFFAPAFYFLFYISLLILQEMNAKKPVLGSFIPDLPQQLILIVFLAFLFGAIGLARKMGITVADSFVSWGKKAGWGALGFAGGLAKTGFRNLGSAAFRRIAPEEGRVQKFLRETARFPGARTLGKIPARAILQQQEVLKKEVKDRASKLAPLRKEEKIAEFRRATLGKDVVAAAQALGADIKDLSNDEIKNVLNLSSQFGLQTDILNYRPDLATANLVPGSKGATPIERDLHAKDLIIKKIDDRTKIAKEAVLRIDPITRQVTGVNDDVVQTLWMNIKSSSELEKIAREAPWLQQAMQNYFNREAGNLQTKMAQDPQDPTNSRAKMIDQYLRGMLGRNIRAGWTTPASWKPIP